MNGMALTLSDSNEQKIYQYSNLSDTAGSELPQDPEAYKIVQSHSPYTGWNLTFYVSQTLQSKDIPWLLKTLLLSFSVGRSDLLHCLHFYLPDDLISTERYGKSHGPHRGQATA